MEQSALRQNMDRGTKVNYKLLTLYRFPEAAVLWIGEKMEIQYEVQ